MSLLELFAVPHHPHRPHRHEVDQTLRRGEALGGAGRDVLDATREELGAGVTRGPQLHDEGSVRGQRRFIHRGESRWPLLHGRIDTAGPPGVPSGPTTTAPTSAWRGRCSDRPLRRSPRPPRRSHAPS
jgi:hypothetical protein